MVTGDSKAWIGTNSRIISLPYDPDNLTLVKQYTYQYNIPSTTTYNSYGASNYPALIDTGLAYPDDISEYNVGNILPVLIIGDKRFIGEVKEKEIVDYLEGCNL